MQFPLLFLVFLSAPAIASFWDFTRDFKHVVFNVTLVCNLPNIREWCAAIYFFDEDSSSSHDPMLWTQSCSKNKTMNLIVDAGMTQGDGGGFGLFQHNYEISYQAYHSCTPLNSRLAQNQLVDCHCSHSPGFIYVDYRSNETDPSYYDNIIYWPHISYHNSDPHCDMPDAFRDLDHCGLPKQRCSWDGTYDEKVWYWSPYHYSRTNC